MTTLLADDLLELRRLKDVAEEEGTDKQAADAAYKKHMAHCLNRMEAEKAESQRTGDYLYSVNKRVKGQIEDRKQYVRWALENDEGIIAFLDAIHDLCVDRKDGLVRLAELEDSFYEAIMGTSMVSYKEDGTIINGQARSHVDDEAPMPPGLTFRPDPYIGMTKS